MFGEISLLVRGHNIYNGVHLRNCNHQEFPSKEPEHLLGSLANKHCRMHTYRGVQGGVPLVGLPQAGRLQMLVAAVALQLTLLARSVQKEGPHCQQEQGPQLLEPQLDHGLWEVQQPQAGVWAGSLGAGLVAAAAAAGASAGSAAAGPSFLHTSAAPCGRPAGQPGAAASGTPAASANGIWLSGPEDP